MRIQLNPGLRAESLAPRYAFRKRLQVSEFLEPDSARSVFDALQELPWGMAYNEGRTINQINPDRLATMDGREATRIMAEIHERAREQYQFLYAYFPASTAYFMPDWPRLKIFDFIEFINSEPVLDFIRNLTGLDQVRWADAHATWYKPGHFLKAHDDADATMGRAAAYVLNLSPNWERDWGGFLQFFNESDNVEEAFKPAFNTLNIFAVPQLHSVSMVSNYVTAKRLAVTGWFRCDAPPGPIGLPSPLPVQAGR